MHKDERTACLNVLPFLQFVHSIRSCGNSSLEFLMLYA
jgi:hypothetical protein